MVIRFFCKTHSYGMKETSQSDFSIAYQAIPKILNEELCLSVVKNYSLSFISHKMALPVFMAKILTFSLLKTHTQRITNTHWMT
jgi:hypothetical protein